MPGMHDSWGAVHAGRHGDVADIVKLHEIDYHQQPVNYERLNECMTDVPRRVLGMICLQ